MKLALRELIRRPGRFAIAGGALTLLVVLLVLLGGLLDGLYFGSTGLLRAQQGELIVYSADARESVLRSRIEADVRDQIDQTPGVSATYGLGVALVGARVVSDSSAADGAVVDAAVVGYEGAISGAPAPPAPGMAWADRRLERDGLRVGDIVQISADEVPLEIEGWVDDLAYLQQGALLVEPETWREVLSSARPDATLAEDTFQVVAVEVADGADVADVRAEIVAATDATVVVLTVDEAILALPGVEVQNSTFGQIIGVTLLVAGVVTALFFAFVTIERTAQYGVLKALGASSTQIYLGLVAQALVVTLGAVVLGTAASLALASFVPPEVPLQIETGRLVFVAVGMAVTAIVGGSISLRRVIRIDPASAIS